MRTCFSAQLVRICVCICVLASTYGSAKPAALAQAPVSTGAIVDPFYLLFVLIGITLVPFIAVMTTSFAKIIIVLSITRQAIGTAQTPPNIVIMSIAIMLTCFSMYPVGKEIYNAVDMKVLSQKNGIESLSYIWSAIEAPLTAFLSKNAKAQDKELFLNLMRENDAPNTSTVSENSLIILGPAFLISELSIAFQIGFLIYLPFLVIDMTVANLLMALGMQMLAPTTISLPFKIMLFVLVDGWRLILEGLSRV